MALLNETESVLSYLDKEVICSRLRFCFLSVTSHEAHTLDVLLGQRVIVPSLQGDTNQSAFRQ